LQKNTTKNMSTSQQPQKRKSKRVENYEAPYIRRIKELTSGIDDILCDLDDTSFLLADDFKEESQKIDAFINDVRARIDELKNQFKIK